MSKTTSSAIRLASPPRRLLPIASSTLKGKTPRTSGRAEVVFLFDVDNTLLDNDRVIADLSRYLQREVGPKRAQCYWALFEQLRTRLSYADYLGALQRYRTEYPHELGLLAVSRFLINYPFANRLFPNSLESSNTSCNGGRPSCSPTAMWCSNPAKWTAPDSMKRLRGAR